MWVSTEIDAMMPSHTYALDLAAGACALVYICSCTGEFDCRRAAGDLGGSVSGGMSPSSMAHCHTALLLPDMLRVR